MEMSNFIRKYPPLRNAATEAYATAWMADFPWNERGSQINMLYSKGTLSSVSKKSNIFTDRPS